jgi:hypothetical protein
LLLPPGKGARTSVLQSPEANVLEERRDLLSPFLPIHAPQHEGELGVLHRREDGKEVVGLEDEPDALQAELGPLALRHGAHLAAVHPDLAPCGIGESADEVHQGGLPRTRRTAEGRELPGLDGEGDVLDGMYRRVSLPEGLPEAFGLHRRVRGRPLSLGGSFLGPLLVLVHGVHSSVFMASAGSMRVACQAG